MGQRLPLYNGIALGLFNLEAANERFPVMTPWPSEVPDSIENDPLERIGERPSVQRTPVQHDSGPSA
jgi:hypothetical protein